MKGDTPFSTENLKACCTCKKLKKLIDFGFNKRYKDGRQLRCRLCCKVADKVWRDANKNKHAKDVSSWRKNNLDKCREYSRKAYRKDPEKHAKYNKSWLARHPEVVAKRSREERNKYPDRKRAHVRVEYALKIGILKRHPCEKCCSTYLVDAHHEDYSKPLDVVWLCRKCHNIHHRKGDKL